MVVYFVLAAVLALVGYFVYRNRTTVAATIKTDVSKISASAKATEIEGKLLAFRALAAVKTEEAKVVHLALDEVNKML